MYFAKRVFSILALLCSIISACRTEPEHPNWKLVERKKCGKSLLNDTTNLFRIVGGKKVKLGKYPWMAQIGRPSKYNPKEVFFYCGGSLINKNYVLTAAHCIHLGPDRKTSTVKLGEHDKTTDKDCENKKCAPPVQYFTTSEIIVYGAFKEETLEKDIALIRLNKPAKFNIMVFPICLPYGGIQEKVSSFLKIAGWGVSNLNRTKTKSPILLETSVEILPLKKCFRGHLNDTKFKESNGSQICAGGKVGYDSCMGDSGGPLMEEKNIEGDYRHFLIGIVSHGISKCGSKYPGIYTKITYFINWILDNIRE